MATKIECGKVFGSTDFEYLACGTIGWLKTINNEVRQCKCVGAKLVQDKDDYAHLEYEWKVAGIKEHLFGTFNTLDYGRIFLTEYDAQHGSVDGYCANKKGIMTPNRKISFHQYLMRKYGLTKDCFEFHGVWYDFVSLSTYGVMKDHTIRLLDTDFDIIVNESGVDIIVPLLDGGVNGKRRYPTKEKAYSSMKPLRSFSLDDDDDVPQTPQKVKITIEIECGKINKLKELGAIIKD